MNPELTALLDRVLEFEADPRPAVLAAAMAEARLLTEDEMTALLVLGDLLLTVHSERDTTEIGTSLYEVALVAAIEGMENQGDPEQSLALPFAVGDLSAFPVLAEAITAARGALRLTPDSVDAKALLGTALYEKYHVTADVEALRESFEAWAELADAHPEIGLYRIWFARTLIALDVWDDDPHHLALALNVLATVVQSLDRTDAATAIPMMFLVEGMEARYQRTFDRKLLDDALLVMADVVGLIGQDHPLSARGASLLGRLLVLRHRLRGDRPDFLRGAVVCHYEAVEAHRSARHMAALEEALQLGLLLDGDEMWLLEAIMAGEQAARHTGPGDAERHSALFALGRALHSLSEEAGVGEEDAAGLSVAFLRLALGCLPAAHPQRDAYTAALAESWMWKFRITDRTIDLSGALEATSQCLRLVPDDHPARPEHLARYGSGLLECYRQVNDLTYLQRAVLTTHKALQAVPEDHPTHAKLLVTLGETTLALADVTEDQEMRLGASGMFRRAALNDSARPPVQAEAALHWAALAARGQKWQEAALAYATAITALRAMTSVQVSRMGQEARLAQFAGIASNAAACFLHTGDTEYAASALEAGRGVLLAQQLRLNASTGTDLTEHLRTRDEATARLEDLDEADGFPTLQAFAAVRQLRRATNRISSLVRNPGHPVLEHDYAAMPTAADWIAQSQAGAIIYVNVSEHRSDALIVQPAGISVVPLSPRECSPATVEAHARQLTEAGQGLAGMMALQRVVPEIMAWLWTAVAAPVLEALGLDHPPSPGEPFPRVWWVPTGHLTLLPVHAAGLPGGPSVLDRAVSSYTPTVRALAHARRPGVSAVSQTIVAMSRTPGASNLPRTLDEALALHDRRPAGSLLVDEDATHDRVLDSLRNTTWAHFACHATNNVADPSHSGLLLHDDLLPLTAITGLRLADAELAYLSACSTGRSSWEHPDEAIHPAGAFQVAGYRHVIGTLWPLYDAVAAEAADAFYRLLGTAATAERAAFALHDVVSGLRTRYPDRPDMWACLTHYGA